MLRICLIALIFVCVIAFPNNGYREERNETIEEINLFDTHQAIINEGYPAETHRVITDDGYILEITRIPHGKKQVNNDSSRPVVFLMHGLTAAANSFIVLGSQHSIGYHLVDAGFDVWMGNARGNAYSRQHVSLDPDDEEDKFKFFDFSFEEIGMYDVAAMIDYVLEKTGNEKLHYIGHSQGGTSFLVLATMRPDYNEKIKAAHLLAGVGYQNHFPNRELSLAARFVDTIYAIALLGGLVEYFPTDPNGQGGRSVNPDYCFGDIKYRNMCYLVGAEELVNDDINLENLQAGAALKQVAHYGQNIRDKMFRRWHYGAFRNIEIYGTRDPPIYDLSVISTYVTMHYSLNDNLLDERDVIAMANNIQRAKVHKVARESFQHEDYIVSRDAKEMATDYIIDDILKIEAGDFRDWGEVEENEQESNGSHNEDEEISNSIDEETSDNEDENNSASEKEEASSGKDEESSTSKDEEVSTSKDEEVSTSKDEEVSTSKDEEVSTSKDEEAVDIQEDVADLHVTGPNGPATSSGVTLSVFQVYLVAFGLKLCLLS